MPILRPEERLGTVLSERYELNRILGKGGMGVVFAGTHTWTGRPVAVKLLLPQYAEEPELLRRFFQEARAAAALEHPNVIDVLDLGEDEEGEAYIVLEYLEGESMAETLKREKTLDIAQLLPIVLPVMDALCEAHEQGIIHRDLKPDNIFIAESVRGRSVPKLLDFGISKLLESQAAATATGGMLGTPQYMSPEQAAGTKDIDGRSDVFSMGVVLYRALTGKLLFVADTPMVMMVKVMTETAAPISELVPDLHASIAAVIDRSLIRERDDRTESMSVFLGTLCDAALEAGVELDSQLHDYRSDFERKPRAIRASSETGENNQTGEISKPVRQPKRAEPRVSMPTVPGGKKRQSEAAPEGATVATLQLGAQDPKRAADEEADPDAGEGSADVDANEDEPHVNRTRPLGAAQRTSITAAPSIAPPPAETSWGTIAMGAAIVAALIGVGWFQFGDSSQTEAATAHENASNPPEQPVVDEPVVNEPVVDDSRESFVEPLPQPDPPSPAVVERMVISDPFGADVIIDSEVVGTAPITLTIPADGNLEITVSRQGYASQTLSVSGRVLGPQTVRLIRERRRPVQDDLAPQ